MSKCRDLEPLLAPYVDGEAPADQRASVETHIERCPPCRTRVEEERAAHEVLHARRDTLRACASDTLRARCAAHCHGTRAAGFMARRPWVPLSLAATLLLAVAGVFAFGLNNTVQALTTQLTLDHVTCFKIGKQTPTDPAEAGHRWAESQGWDVTVPASSNAQDLEFVCLRRCLVTEGRVAHLMYKWRGQPLSLYVLPSSVGETGSQQIVERFGHEAVVWTNRGRTYVVLSRGRPDELDSVVRYVKASVQ
jgi:anti-sigma factor RsiW